MKKILLYGLMTAMMIACFSLDADAQKRRKKKKKKKKPSTEKESDYFDESGGIKHRLWYGGSGALQFSAISENQRLFSIGLTPMVGYKITDNFSVGPKVGVTYSSIKEGNLKANLTDFSVGAFSRYKILNVVFVHAELEYENRELPDDVISGEVITIRDSATNGYLGLGYNSGNGALGYEVYVLYNFLEDEPLNSINVPFISITAPIVFRVGLTYKF